MISWGILFATQGDIMAVNGSSDLLSKEDKRLAVSNAIGFATTWGLNACLSSNVSKDTKTLSEIAGFVATSANNIWRQSLTARLPLAQQYKVLRGAVHPLSYVGMTAAANLFARDRNGDLAKPGFGLSLVTPAATAVVVGHNALQKLGRCFSEMTTRPWDALKAIPIHMFNLVSSANWAISSWSGASDWSAQNQFFENQGADISQASHAFWNPGLKIQADAVESAENLAYFQESLDQVKIKFKKSCDEAKSLKDLMNPNHDKSISDLENSPRLKRMYLHDKNKVKLDIFCEKSKMSALWCLAVVRLPQQK